MTDHTAALLAAKRILMVNDPLEPSYLREARLGVQEYGDALASDANATARALIAADAELQDFARAKLAIVGFVFNCKCAEAKKKGDLIADGTRLVEMRDSILRWLGAGAMDRMNLDDRHRLQDILGVPK